MLVFLTILLLFALKLISKLHQYKQQESQFHISIIYKTGNQNLPRQMITMKPSVFWTAFALSSFLLHSASRETQFFVLLPLQIMAGAIGFPILIIFMSANMKTHFLEKHSYTLSYKKICRSNNQVGTVYNI